MTDLIEASMSALAERYTPPVMRIIKPIIANENNLYDQLTDLED